eukprot:CAMPEP_0119299350 /NCGR_PEP_ID=MMETSP1333-20130426/1424_1 /TAXON_ID=418940 /ORGANISM="Scyphosphaera apsteinii, Strain RCC1455" /LENGTH=147 /DNA_ID=CAMNT_0007300743 /DNA_START=160 /DNA_END=603 /DNA_ORIENTATION=-
MAAPCSHVPAHMDFGDWQYLGHQYAGRYGPKSGDNSLPADVYEIAISRPLGIGFEEVSDSIPRGVKVVSLVPDGAAERSGKLAVGDELVGVTGVIFQGAKFERQMIDCTRWDFDTVVDAIGSNEARFGCEDVILQFRRPKQSAEGAS